MKVAEREDQIGLSPVLIVSVTILLLLFTRLITVDHNIELHPDEPVFYKAADSLMHFMAGAADEYTEIKEYPEGAIVLQLPFHIAAAIIHRCTGIQPSIRLCGRIASIFYFSLGAVFGCIIEYQHFGKNKKSAIAYSLILVFSIMHIEQSRYGTGDAISFFLTMLILFLVLKRGRKGKKSFVLWFLPGFLSGLLCSVKYPMLFWGLVPLIMAWRTEKKRTIIDYLLCFFLLAW